MFAYSKSLIPKFGFVIGIATVLVVAGSSRVSGEPIQSSGTTPKPDAAQEKKNNILQYRAYRPSQSVRSAPGLNENTPMPALPTPVVPTARTSRQSQELLDRQKNWIFASPQDEKKTGSADEAFGIDEFLLDDQKSKSVVTRFLENRQSKDSKSPDAKGNESDKDKKKDFVGPQTFGLGNEKQNQSGNSLQPDSMGRNFNERGARELSLPALWREQNGPDANKMREEKQLRMNEFQSFFGSQGTVSPGAEFNNFGQQSAGPGAADSFNRSPTSFRSPDPSRSVHSVAGVGVAGPPDVNARVFGQSAARIPAAEPPRSVQQPAVLPVPKRRF